MKKILLAAVGMAGLLAACDGAVIESTDTGYYGSYNKNASVTLRSLTGYTTNHQLSQEARDQNNQPIPAGTPIICQNWDTTVEVNVNWSGHLREVGFQFKGLKSGNYVNTGNYIVGSPTSGSGKATFTLNPGMAPLNLKPQSIVVVPKVTVLGYTYIRAQGIDGNGYASNTITTNYSIPVMECYNG